ncbi:KR domain [Rhizoctonia solani]|uniref:KR domain n=1 Tax=Rhizoctonia solani TaxID=456999 RepID=A0A8H7HDW2_9AGAM|nr:KR domain [Rhizoctonia solani]
MTFPSKSLFSVDQIPDLTGQVTIVTGGNTGIGKETCKASRFLPCAASISEADQFKVLLLKNAKVYLAARSKARADEAIQWLERETNGKSPIFLELDLANLDSVREAAEEFMSKEKELHILFNNAGVLEPPVELRTVDGYDLQFGTNTLGHYFFTSLLLTTLIHTARNSPVAGGHARVVTTSSMAAFAIWKGSIVWETLGTDMASQKACKKAGTRFLYCQSKLGNVLFSNELAKHYEEQGIVACSVHPGVIQSELFRYVPRLFAKAVVGRALIVYPASQGALTQLWAGTMPEGLEHNGKASGYLVPWAQVGVMPPGARDGKVAEKLWTWLEEQVKGH